jgi:hypothetical protein
MTGAMSGTDDPDAFIFTLKNPYDTDPMRFSPFPFYSGCQIYDPSSTYGFSWGCGWDYHPQYPRYGGSTWAIENWYDMSALAPYNVPNCGGIYAQYDRTAFFMTHPSPPLAGSWMCSETVVAEMEVYFYSGALL